MNKLTFVKQITKKKTRPHQSACVFKQQKRSFASPIIKPIQNNQSINCKYPSKPFSVLKPRVEKKVVYVPQNNKIPLRVIMIGAPGSGKGTQSAWINRDYGVSTLSTGDVLRKVATQNTPLGKQIGQTLKTGGLIDDKTMIQLLSPVLQSSSYLLDGFPRTLGQAEALQQHLYQNQTTIDFVFNLQVSEDVLWERVKDRWVHPASGRTYNLAFQPPKVPFRDDITGEPLVQRSDDTRDAIKNRLDLFHSHTQPVVEQLAKFCPRVIDIDSPTSKQGYALIQNYLDDFVCNNFAVLK